MSLLERVQAIEDERRGEDDGRVRIGIETLRSAVGEIVPLDRVAAMADESPERARNEVRAACRRAAMHDPWLRAARCAHSRRGCNGDYGERYAQRIRGTERAP